MRAVAAIPTPWPPYSVMFSRDGSRIAIGGGTWYGDGGLLLVDLSTGQRELFSCTDLLPSSDTSNPTVSGVCFSEDDRLLAVSTRNPRLSYGPTFLLEISGLRVAYRETFRQECEDTFGGPYPTGVLLYGGSLITRNNASSLADVVAIWRLPERQDVAGDRAAQHLTHSRMAVVRNQVITGGGGSLRLGGWRADLGRNEDGKAADGLVFAPLEADGHRASAIRVDGCRRITAIVAAPSGDGFLTGGLDGELDRWSRNEGWNPERLQGATEAKAAAAPGLAWATYTPNSIVGICYLAGAERWASVDASGELSLWAGNVRQGSWQIPVPGSPRALAAHPVESRIAIGVKQGGFTHPESVVVLADLG